MRRHRHQGAVRLAIVLNEMCPRLTLDRRSGTATPRAPLSPRVKLGFLFLIGVGHLFDAEL